MELGRCRSLQPTVAVVALAGLQSEAVSRAAACAQQRGLLCLQRRNSLLEHCSGLLHGGVLVESSLNIQRLQTEPCAGHRARGCQRAVCRRVVRGLVGVLIRHDVATRRLRRVG